MGRRASRALILCLLIFATLPAFGADKQQIVPALPAGVLKLIAQREDMQPWAGRSLDEMDRWLVRGVRFNSDNERMVSKFYYTKLVLLANCIQEGIFDRPYLLEGGVYHGFWFESAPVTMQVFARIDAEHTQCRP